jgi:GxxExxY protein
MLFYILFVFLAFLAVNESYCVDCIKLMRLGGHGGCGVRSEPGEAYDRVAHAVIGAAIEVHRHLGPGYSEAVYGNALEIELRLRDIPFERKKPVEVFYKGDSVGKGEVDYFVDGILVVELKTVDSFASIHFAQVISYLKAFDRPLGLLIKFKVPMLKDGVKRVAFSADLGDDSA